MVHRVFISRLSLDKAPPAAGEELFLILPEAPDCEGSIIFSPGTCLFSSFLPVSYEGESIFQLWWFDEVSV